MLLVRLKIILLVHENAGKRSPINSRKLLSSLWCNSTVRVRGFARVNFRICRISHFLNATCSSSTTARSLVESKSVCKSALGWMKRLNPTHENAVRRSLLCKHVVALRSQKLHSRREQSVSEIETVVKFLTWSKVQDLFRFERSRFIFM